MAGTGASFWLSRYWPPALALVVLCLAINWFGDSLDGTLARVQEARAPRYGYYVDHVLDVFGMGLLVVGMALSGYMTPVIALSMLAAYLLVSAEVVPRDDGERHVPHGVPQGRSDRAAHPAGRWRADALHESSRDALRTGPRSCCSTSAASSRRSA